MAPLPWERGHTRLISKNNTQHRRKQPTSNGTSSSTHKPALHLTSQLLIPQARAKTPSGRSNSSCHSKTMNNDTAPTEHTPEQQAALERLNIAQKNLVRARAAYEKAAEGLKAIGAFDEAMKPLMAYYDNGWLADVNATDSIYERPEAAGEDEIWNMHGGQYELMRELLAISSRFFVHVPGQEEDN